MEECLTETVSTDKNNPDESCGDQKSTPIKVYKVNKGKNRSLASISDSKTKFTNKTLRQMKKDIVHGKLKKFKQQKAGREVATRKRYRRKRICDKTFPQPASVRHVSYMSNNCTVSLHLTFKIAFYEINGITFLLVCICGWGGGGSCYIFLGSYKGKCRPLIGIPLTKVATMNYGPMMYL